MWNDVDYVSQCACCEYHAEPQKSKTRLARCQRNSRSGDVRAHENHWEVSSDDGRHAHLPVGPIRCAVEELQVCHSQFPAKKLKNEKLRLKTGKNG